jgi:hypothetical protein
MLLIFAGLLLLLGAYAEAQNKPKNSIVGLTDSRRAFIYISLQSE